MKGVFLIGFAIFIDALQAAFALIFTALEAVTPVGGGFGAAGVCAAFSNGIIDKLVNGVTCFFVGAGASAFAIPIGAAVDVALSVALGSALVAALAFTGYFSFGAVMGGSLLEMLPLLDAIVPGWTLMAWRCVHNKRQEERAAMNTPTTAQSVQAPVQAFDGIRPANDNTPVNDMLYDVQLAA
jgi:hypothetical protein